jgi:hypothetical protein
MVDMMSERQTLLRSEFSALYPDIPAGVWIPATRVAFLLTTRVVRAHRHKGMLPDRILSAQQFAFAGGRYASRSERARARATDEVAGAPSAYPRVVGRCEGCQCKVVLVQAGTSERVTSTPALRTFLVEHEPCRRRVTNGPFFTLHERLP